MDSGLDPIRRGDATKRRAPTVLQVLPALDAGGVERGTVDVARALSEAGWRAVVASAGGPMVQQVERAGARHVTLPLASRQPLAIRANVGRLAELIEAEGVALVHARSRAPAWSALMAARRTRRPFVTTFHGAYGLGHGLKRWYNSVMTRGDRVIAISHFIAEHIRHHYRLDDERLRVVPRGIDLELFDPARVAAQRVVQLAGTWRLPDAMPVIMLPGRLTRLKGQMVLVDALAELGRSDVRCLLVGASPGRRRYREALERRIRARRLESVVHIIDACRDMPAAYMLADVVVSASVEPEAFGRVIVEAQAMGRPTVATDHGAARETLLAGETGWLVPPGDTAGLAAALDKALALGTAARERLAARAIAHARKAFSKEAMCARTLAIYRELLGERAGADGARAAE